MMNGLPLKPGQRLYLDSGGVADRKWIKNMMPFGQKTATAKKHRYRGGSAPTTPAGERDGLQTYPWQQSYVTVFPPINKYTVPRFQIVPSIRI